MTTKSKLNLSQFYGSENFYKVCIFSKGVVTDGVKYFADEAGAYWFLDIVATEIEPLLVREEFIAITLRIEVGKAFITATDGNDGDLFKKFIPFTDCPEGDYNFFLQKAERIVLMLTSEY